MNPRTQSSEEPRPPAASRSGRTDTAPAIHQTANQPSGFTFHPFSDRPRLIALFLFIAAVLPRLPGLGRFLTSDENTNIFIAGSDVIAAFLQGNLRGTYWHFYPGVTMSWLDALGIGGQYLVDAVSGTAVPAFKDYIYSDILSLVVAARLPYVLLTAAAVPITYLLVRRLFSERVAILGALFMAFDPFYLAHSRVAHGDAPVAVFMSLSALTFFIFTEQKLSQPVSASPKTTGRWRDIAGSAKNPYLVSSAVLGSLAALTKAPGQFMALFVIGMSVIYAVLEFQSIGRNSRYSLAAIARRWLTVVLLWGLISLAAFILLWPSMWVDPVGTLRRLWLETFIKVDEGHLVYFFGRPTLDPGFWFYFYVIPFRLTPVVLIGSGISLVLLVAKAGQAFSLQDSKFRLSFFLWLFTISLLLFANLSPKKQDRYLLPLFPFINLLAVIGWLGLLDLVIHLLQSRYRAIFRKRHLLLATAALFLLLLHLLPTLTYYPYYLTYFNPLLGGPQRAAETTLMGWGEGMEQVAAYLNTKPNAKDLYVASTPSQTLLPYFAGTGENFYTNDIAFRADYVVLYLAQRQRLAPSPEIVRYFEGRQPEKIITIRDIPYAKIYTGPKLIRADIPPAATPANIGLDDTIRLAGYEISDLQSPPASRQLTLYWHALKPLSVDYAISIRARAADGSLLVQRDSWPVDGLLPTSLWRQGDYVADAHTLEIPKAGPGPIDHFEIVVYNSETGETLGPPITISMSHQSLTP